jgi:hypothetical protein
VASCSADEIEPFEVREVRSNGKPVNRFSVANGSFYSHLNRANAVEDLKMRLASDWKPSQELEVEVVGIRPGGKPI